MAKRPNILIFMTDQEQAQVVLPSHPCHTPNAARLASEGILFTQAYTPAAHCCPSRATFMTGLYPSRHGVYNNVKNTTAIHDGLKPGVTTFDQHLARAGYRMLFCGKWHVTNEENPADRAWEELFVTARGREPRDDRTKGWQERQSAEDEDERLRCRGELLRKGWGPFRLYGTSMARPETDPYHPGDLRVVRHAVEALGSLGDSDRPWCLFVGTHGPHDPYIIPEHYAMMYAPEDVPLPASYYDMLTDKPRIYQRQRRLWAQLTESEVRESIAHYWGYCTMQDDLLGMVLDALDATGQADDTAVVFLSDHGDYVGSHGLYLKGVASFDEAYHVPLAIRWPAGIENGGRVVSEFVTLADFAPTFLELAGVDAPERLSGASLTPFFAARAPAQWRDAVHTQFNGVELYYSQRIVQTARWKYVYNGFDFDELYDRQNDPHEMRNLIAHGNLAGVVRAMCARMWRFAAQEQDHIHNAYPTVSLAPYGPMVAFHAADD
jgi:arylsulfatase A-like enzyme